MAIEAPLSSYKKKNMIIMIVVLLGLCAWCIYDGYINKEFIEDHQDEYGNPKGWLVVNQKAPPFLLVGAVVYGVYFFMMKDKKVIADDNALQAGKVSIAYDAIESINKTHFDSKGYFIVTYTDGGQTKEIKVSDRTYDNLPAVLDHLVAKIS